MGWVLLVFPFKQRSTCMTNNSCSWENVPGVPIYYDDVTRVAWQQYIERLRGLLFSSLRYYTFPMKRTDQNPADQVSQLRGLCRGVMRVHSQFNDLHLKVYFTNITSVNHISSNDSRNHLQYFKSQAHVCRNVY